MGKGDKKSRRGKIIIGSYGVRRPKSSKSKSLGKVEAAPAEAIEKVKKNTEKPKSDPKPKVKEIEPVVAVEPDPNTTVKKGVKKVIKKTVDGDEAIKE
jgi:30S ribosomal protein S31